MSNKPTAAARPVAPQVDPIPAPNGEVAAPEQHKEVPTAKSPTGKLIKVKTTGDFHKQEPTTGVFIDSTSEGTDVRETQWVLDQLEIKQLELA